MSGQRDPRGVEEFAETHGVMTGNTVDNRVETVFTEDMTNDIKHETSIGYLPMLDRWVPVCSYCGRIGGASFPDDEKADARAIAERHAEIGGFEVAR